jgi:hypothetical protein
MLVNNFEGIDHVLTGDSTWRVLCGQTGLVQLRLMLTQHLPALAETPF